MGTTDRIGLWAMYLLAPDRGFTGGLISMAMWIIATIHTMDTMAPCPHVAHNHSITSKGMKLGTGAARWSQRRITMAPVNMPCQGSAVAVHVEANAARNDRTHTEAHDSQDDRIQYKAVVAANASC